MRKKGGGEQNRMLRGLLAALLAVGLVIPQLLHAGQMGTPSSEGGSETYRIGAGDVLLVVVEGQAELSGTLTVARDGCILMPLIKRIRAVDRTTGELEEEIAARLRKDYIVDPQVSVGVREYNSRQVYVMIGDGAVVRRPIGVRGTLSELLLESGLPSKAFSRGEAIVTRTESTKPGDPDQSRVVAKVDLHALMLKGDVKQDVQLRRGDVVRIPSPETRFVYLLVGDAPPATVPLGEKGTLSELLLEAKLPSSVFSGGRATVTRTEDDNQGGPPTAKEVADVDLSKLMVKHDQSEDCVLVDGDIVRIPESAREYLYLLIERPTMRASGSSTRPVERGAQATGSGGAYDKPHGRGVPPSLGSRPGIQRVKYLLGEVRALSRVLLDAEIEAELFESSVAMVRRIEKRGDGAKSTSFQTSTVVDLYELVLNLDKNLDVDLEPNDLVHIIPRREAVDHGHIYALGAVQKPGAYECSARKDAREVIKEAGGYLPEIHDPGLIIVRRTDTDGELMGTYSITRRHRDAPEFLVHAGDTVYVPSPRATKQNGHVQVLGNVARPGKIPFEAEMTVGDALEKAGGSDGLPSLGKIVVKRVRERGVDTVARLLKVNLEERYEGRGPKLEAGDIVIVHP